MEPPLPPHPEKKELILDTCSSHLLTYYIVGIESPRLYISCHFTGKFPAAWKMRANLSEVVPLDTRMDMSENPLRAQG